MKPEMKILAASGQGMAGIEQAAVDHLGNLDEADAPSEGDHRDVPPVGFIDQGPRELPVPGESQFNRDPDRPFSLEVPHEPALGSGILTNRHTRRENHFPAAKQVGNIRHIERMDPADLRVDSFFTGDELGQPGLDDRELDEFGDGQRLRGHAPDRLRTGRD